MLGELTAEQIERMLHEEILGRLGCQAGGRPYVVPVTYAYDGERIICYSAVGQKILAMRENPDVCFEVEQVENIANWRSVIAWGTFEELHGQNAAAAMGLLVDKLLPAISSAKAPSQPVQSVTPHGKVEPGIDTIVYCIRLKEKTGRFEIS